MTERSQTVDANKIANKAAQSMAETEAAHNSETSLESAQASLHETTPLVSHSHNLGTSTKSSSGTGFFKTIMHRFRSPVFTSIVLASTIATGCAVYYGAAALAPKPAAKPAAVTPAVVTVKLAPVLRREIDDSFSVTGSVSPWDPLTVTCETSGLHIQTINVEEGATVKKGQVLATIYSGLLQAQLAQLQARLASSEATLRKSIQPNRPEDILALKAALSQAEAVIIQEEAHRRQAEVNVRNAELNEKRYQGLQKTGAISEEAAETKMMTADNARHELLSADRKVESAKMMADQAKQHLLLAQKGGRIEDVQISRANIEEIKAQIKHVQEQIKQTIILAPDDGVISHRNCHIGDTPGSGSTLFGMIRKNRLELRAQVSDLDLIKFKPGQEVLIATNEADKVGIKGTVRLVSPQVDPATRMGTVRITLPSDEGLKPGMFVRGEVKLGKKQSLTVPINSVVNHDGESFVFTVDGDRAMARDVKLGARLEDCIEVKQGLKENELIVDKGARFLNDRDVIRIAPDDNSVQTESASAKENDSSHSPSK